MLDRTVIIEAMKTKNTENICHFNAGETEQLLKDHMLERLLLLKNKVYSFRFPMRKLNQCKRIVEQTTGIDFATPVYSFRPSTHYDYGRVDIFTFHGTTWFFEHDERRFGCISLEAAFTNKEARALFYRF